MTREERFKLGLKHYNQLLHIDWRLRQMGLEYMAMRDLAYKVRNGVIADHIYEVDPIAFEAFDTDILKLVELLEVDAFVENNKTIDKLDEVFNDFTDLRVRY